MDYIKRHELFKNVQNLSVHLMDQLQSLYEHSIVGDIRGKGFMIGVEFVKDKKTKEPFGSEKSGKIAGLISRQCLKNGLVVYPGSGEVDGRRGDHILVAPPFIITKNQINEMVALLDRSIQEVMQDVL